LLDEQISWMLKNGGLAWCAARSQKSADHLYSWATERSWAEPFVRNAAERSAVVGTIDLTGVEASDINAALRANGVVDTDSYRKLGRNQLRVGMFPAIDPEDVVQLTRSIDFVVEQLIP
jgi:phosphoserine aminotransferase